MIPNDTILIFQEQTGFGNNFERKPSSISSKWFLHFFFWWKMKNENSDSVQQFSRIIQSNGGTIIIQDDPDLERWKEGPFFSFVQQDYKLVFCQTESFEILEWMILSILLNVNIQISFNSWRPSSTVLTAAWWSGLFWVSLKTNFSSLENSFHSSCVSYK